MPTFNVPITTDGSGNADVTFPLSRIGLPPTGGKLDAIHYVRMERTAFSNGVDFSITDPVTGEVILNENDVNSSAIRRPRAATHTTAGAAALYAAGRSRSRIASPSTVRSASRCPAAAPTRTALSSSWLGSECNDHRHRRHRRPGRGLRRAPRSAGKPPLPPPRPAHRDHRRAGCHRAGRRVNRGRAGGPAPGSRPPDRTGCDPEPAVPAGSAGYPACAEVRDAGLPRARPRSAGLARVEKLDASVQKLIAEVESSAPDTEGRRKGASLDEAADCQSARDPTPSASVWTPRRARSGTRPGGAVRVAETGRVPPGSALRVGSGAVLEAPALLPVSTMSAVVGERSRSAVVILGSPKTAGHSPKARLVVTTTEVCLVEPADEVEEQLAAGLGEGEVAEPRRARRSRPCGRGGRRCGPCGRRGPRPRAC